MTARTNSHTISHARNLFSGAAYHAGAATDRGIPRDLFTQVSLGTPTIADPNFLAEAQASAGGGAMTLTNTVLDVPRTLTIDSDSASDSSITALITGADAYGEAMSELLAFNGTTVVGGQKAFKTVSSIVISGAAVGTALVAGTADILGLPYRIASAEKFLMARADGALDLTSSAVLGTVVAADDTDPATTTTNDVRGTYNPNVTLDGSAEVVVDLLVDGDSKEVAYGVTQA